jgi:hypothetical protein
LLPGEEVGNLKDPGGDVKSVTDEDPLVGINVLLFALDLDEPDARPGGVLTALVKELVYVVLEDEEAVE